MSALHISTIAKTSVTWVSTHRYTLLVSFLFIQVLAFSLQGIWVEDFWEHSAAVYAFMRDPLNPAHPQLGLNAPHTFLNPYTFIVALSASTLHLTPITALSIFGLLNFGVLCWGLKIFISSICDQDADKVSFYALLFILFLWGSKPWPYSGFFNYQIFLFNLPYPSTLIGGLSLLTLGYVGRKELELGLAQWACVAAVICLALLAHPLTAQFLVIGLAAQAVVIGGKTFIKLLKIAAVCICAIGLACLWPFYPFLTLLLGAGSVYDISNGDMYFHFLERVWPFILLSPIIAWTLLQKAYRAVLLIFLVTVVVYIFGYVTGKYSYGRIVSYTIIMAQICCAIVVVKLEQWLGNTKPSASLMYQFLLALSLTVLSADWLHASANRLLTAANSVRLGRPIFNQVSFQEYTFLRRAIPDSAIVLANLDVSWLLPSFGAKVIAADHALAFVDDAEVRRTDTIKFFNGATLLTERNALIQKYHSAYLLIDKKTDTDWRAIYQQFTTAKAGTVSAETDRFALIKLESPSLR